MRGLPILILVSDHTAVKNIVVIRLRLLSIQTDDLQVISPSRRTTHWPVIQNALGALHRRVHQVFAISLALFVDLVSEYVVPQILVLRYYGIVSSHLNVLLKV